MGKNKARHILHGVLDCLPIILIPIFMIYSQNHEINDNTLQVQESKVVDFNQLYYKDYAYFPYTQTMCGNVTTSFNSDYISVNGTMTQNTNYVFGMSNNLITLKANHVYILKCQLPQRLRLQQNYYGSNGNQVGAGINTENNTVKFTNYIEGNLTTYVIMDFSQDLNFDNIILRPQLYDLTLMNMEDVTIENFNLWFNDYPYPYTENQEVVIENYKTITYDDTDIMSQSFYCLYNAVDKYFNMGNVFGMKNLYTWFEVNIFGGTASPSIYVVWNIVLYEFIMDLLFLLYGLFMFFIDLCKRLMEKPLNSIK